MYASKYEVNVCVDKEITTVFVTAYTYRDAKLAALLLVGLPETEDEIHTRALFGEDMTEQLDSLAKLCCTISSEEEIHVRK